MFIRQLYQNPFSATIIRNTNFLKCPMSTPPETAPSTPSLTPQERLDALQEEIQNARNAPPITPDRRTALQNSLDDLRANTSIDQAELNRLDQEILSFPTP